MYRFKQLMLVVGDVLLFYAGLLASIYIRFGSLAGNNNLPELLQALGFLYAIGVLILFIIGLYDIGRIKPGVSLYRKVGLSALLWVIAGVVYFYLNPELRITPKTTLVLNALVTFFLIGLWRIVQNRLLVAEVFKTSLVFAGYTPEVEQIIARIQKEPGRGYQVAGIITDQPNALPPTIALISPEQLYEEIRSQHINVIVLGPEFANNSGFLKALYAHLFKKIEIVTLAELYEEIFGRIPPFIFSESWFLTNLREQQKKIYDRFRILIDYAIAGIIGLFFMITVPLIALLIKLTSSGPIFFSQKRIGRLGRPFTIYKFRTMKVLSADGSAEVNGPEFAQTDDARITTVGKILRRARLDELPQFFNILNGDMALIGPRPERPEFVKKLTETMPFYSLRHLIKPGLMGWAQLQESYYGTIAENLRKLEYDLYYIKNRGALLDLTILLRTIPIVARMIGR